MPTYEYECGKCGHKFSLTIPLQEYPRKKVRCVKCKSENVKRVVASVFVTTSKKS